MMMEREMIVEPFSVRVETRAPRDARDVLPDDAATDGLMDLLKDYDGVVSSGPGSWDAIVTIPANDPRDAAEEAARMIEALAAKAGMPAWSAVRVEAVRQDVLAEQLARPSLPDLVSAPEAADILGVKPQRIHRLVIEHGDFPEPAHMSCARQVVAARGHRGFRAAEAAARAPARIAAAVR